MSRALAEQKVENIRSLLATYDIEALLAPVTEMLEAEIAAQQKD